MLRSVVFVALLLILGSCVSTKKHAKWVRNNLYEVASVDKADISFSYRGQTLADSIQITKIKSHFIPALFYWNNKTNFMVEVDHSVYGKYFENSFVKYSRDLGLLDKLKDRKLSIVAENLPSKYEYDFDHKVFFFVLAYAQSFKETIEPKDYSLKMNFEYSFLDTNNNRIEREFSLHNNLQPLQNIWKSSKGFTKRYLTHYKEGLDMYAKALVEHILSEVDRG